MTITMNQIALPMREAPIVGDGLLEHNSAWVQSGEWLIRPAGRSVHMLMEQEPEYYVRMRIGLARK